MNRAKLLATLAGLPTPYTGGADLVKVKSYISDNSINLVGGDGKPLDIDAVWNKATTLTVADDEPAGSKAIQTETADTLEVSGTDAIAFKAWQKAETKAARTSGAPNLIESKGKAVASIARKNYERKINSGTAVFSDVDHAEHFGALARFALAEFMNIKAYTRRDDDLEILGKTATTFVNSAAGVLIPTEYIANLIYLTEKYGVARKLANVQPMSRDVVMRPRKTAIISMAYINEATAPTSQDNTYDMVELVARKVMGTSVISNELLEDAAVNVADDLAQSYAEAYAIIVDQTYFLGDASATYGGQRGLANALPSGAYLSGAGNSWSALTAANLDTLPGTVENVDVKRCAYVSSRQFFYQRVNSLDTAASQFKALVGPGINGSDASYKGWPWWFSQVLPTATASGSKVVYFGDFAAGSMIGERRDFSLAASEHVGFTSDVMTYRATARVCVNVHGDGRGSTYGPIVCLKTT